MAVSAAFIVNIPDEPTFYEIKRFLEQLDDSRLIYCTRGKDKLYIKKEGEM